MANAERGEVALTVTNTAGETREYTLKLSMNAAAEMETKRKMPIGQIVGQVEQLSMQAIRDIAFVLLQKYHKDEIKTVEQAGNLIDDAGGPEQFFAAFRALVEINKPPAVEGSENPPMAQAGAGSTSTPAVTA